MDRSISCNGFHTFPSYMSPSITAKSLSVRPQSALCAPLTLYYVHVVHVDEQNKAESRILLDKILKRTFYSWKGKLDAEEKQKVLMKMN
ncbi:hypothetical protein J6590_073851 [Homalodisca vitripennis]|nr:hypothetical protein J6590_073851 [Homalodisca vitripennis]